MVATVDSPMAIAALCIFLITSTLLYRAFTNPLRSLPGLWHSALTRLPLKLAIMSGRRAFYVHALHHAYGPVVRIAPDEVAISDTKGLTEIHRNGSGFKKTSWYLELTGQHNVFTMTDPKEHAERRKMLARPFSRSFLLQHWHQTVKELTQLAVSRMRETAAVNSGRIDVLEWWTFMTMDLAGRIMFGHSFNHLETGKVSDVMRAIVKFVTVKGVGVELPWLPTVGKILGLIPLQSMHDIFRTDDVLARYASKYLDSINASQTSSNIFSNIAAQAGIGEKLAIEDVHLDASGLTIAAADTTAVTLTYLVWAVLSRPNLQQELEREVDTLSEDYNDTDLEKLPLLNAAIEETLRLYGAAPAGLPREVPSSGMSVNNEFIPAGTTVTTQAYTYHRDPELFPRPDEFIPTRWLNDELSPEARRAFHPFGIGSRICLGIHLAYMELRLASAEFFRQCKGAKLAAETTDASMDMENYFLVTPRGHKCEVILP